MIGRTFQRVSMVALAIGGLLVGAPASALRIVAGQDAAVATGPCSTYDWGQFALGGWLSMHLNPCLQAEGSSAGLVQFALPGLDAGDIDTAVLRLRQTSNAFSGDVYSLYRITEAWDEATVTGFTPPGVDPLAVSSLTLDAAGVAYRDFDVSSIVRAWAAGSAANHGLMLARSLDAGDVFPDEYADYVYFASREVDQAAWRPTLFINQPPAVPEPAPAAMLLAGLAWLSVRLRRRG